MSSTGERFGGLTGPGGPFEVATEEVAGFDRIVFRDRMRSLSEVLSAAVSRGDSRDYIVYGSRRIGFETFVRSAWGMAQRLRDDLDLRRGQRVAILAQNCPEWIQTFWATVDAGGVVVGLNGWWNPEELVFALDDSQARILVVDRPRFDRLAPHLDRCRALTSVFVIDDTGSPSPGARPFSELGGEPSSHPVAAHVDEDDAATILYTSGTTGRPKGAVSTHRNMLASLQTTLFSRRLQAQSSASQASTRAPAVSLFTSPLFHVSGLHSSVIVGLLAGVRLVMLEGRFDPAKALRLIEDERVTVWATVPTLVWRVCESPDRDQFDTSSVTAVSYGGSPSGAELQRMVRQTFPGLRAASNAYGLTETSSAVTVLTPADALDRPASVGRPLPTVELRIVGDDGVDLPANEVGEIWVAGPMVTPGYWDRVQELPVPVTSDGWFRTGDLGFVDEDGFVFITDRLKDVIIRGGENVYSVEVEERLLEHPAVSEAAVVGVPHVELGEEVVAVVYRHPGAELDPAELRSWVAASLANFKVPTTVHLVDQPLPRNAAGKVLKTELRQTI